MCQVAWLKIGLYSLEPLQTECRVAHLKASGKQEKKKKRESSVVYTHIIEKNKHNNKSNSNNINEITHRLVFDSY
jgi:hypothetical protein